VPRRRFRRVKLSAGGTWPLSLALAAREFEGEVMPCQVGKSVAEGERAFSAGCGSAGASIKPGGRLKRTGLGSCRAPAEPRFLFDRGLSESSSQDPEDCRLTRRLT
jgi:hypothetical protein